MRVVGASPGAGQERVPAGSPRGGRYTGRTRGHSDVSLPVEPRAKSLVYGLRLAGSDEIRYVGKTTRGLKQRLSEHKHSANAEKPVTPVHKWMKSHGPETIVGVALVELGVGDDRDLNELEMAAILQYRSEGHRLLNLTDGGEGTMGIAVSEEKRRRMSELMSGANNPMYGVHRYGEANPMYGRTGERAPGFGRTGGLSPMFGKTHSDELKAKWSVERAGEGNPMFGRKGQLAPGYGKTGEANPMYGKPSPMRGVTGPDHPSYGKTKSPEVITRMREGMHRAHHVEKNRPKAGCEFCLAIQLQPEATMNDLTLPKEHA